MRGPPRLLDLSSAPLTTGSFTYASRDGGTGLVCRYAYCDGVRNAPVVTLAHGYSEDASAIPASTMERWARRGFLAAAFGMRGRDGATGTKDASGRELLDHLDGMAALIAQFPDLASFERWGAVGYSGGGGNLYGVLAKIPDLYSFYAVHFGMSRYGLTPGWWGTNAAFQGIIEAQVGGSPAAVPNDYAARDHVDGMLRNLGMAPPDVGLHVMHDESDGTVSVRQAQEVERRVLELRLSSQATFNLNYQSSGEAHGYPDTVPALVGLEDGYWRRIFNCRPWLLPPAGRTTVTGYLVSRGGREVWLADPGAPDPSAVSYCRHRAIVTWSGNSFTVTPLTGSVAVLVRNGGLQASATVSNTTTLMAA